MIKKNIQTYVKCVALTCIILLAISSDSSANNCGGDLNEVGFACMNLVTIRNSRWRGEFHDLAEAVYEMQYNSFKKIVSKMQKKGLKPKSLIDPSSDESKPFLAANEKEVKQFHRKMAKTADRYLAGLACGNNSRLIVTAKIGKHNVEDFIAGKKKLYFSIKIYDITSNTIGTEYVPLTKELFNNPPRLMKIIEDKVMLALDTALINTDTSYPVAETGNLEFTEESTAAQDSDDSIWE